MSAEAEARSGILGREARKLAIDKAPGRGMPTWPMTPEQWAWTRTIIDVGGWRALAWWIRERAARGVDRFSHQDVPFDALGSDPHQLLVRGLMREHRYPSGAWQYAANPFTRSWYMAMISSATGAG